MIVSNDQFANFANTKQSSFIRNCDAWIVILNIIQNRSVRNRYFIIEAKVKGEKKKKKKQLTIQTVP
jgi:hypothetical protein